MTMVRVAGYGKGAITIAPLCARTTASICSSLTSSPLPLRRSAVSVQAQAGGRSAASQLLAYCTTTQAHAVHPAQAMSIVAMAVQGAGM